MGSRIPVGDELSFYAHAPLEGNIRMLKNGDVVHRVKGKKIDFRAHAPGVYRIEVFRMKRGWIYSNPIVITESPKGEQ
jgi:hypothetical protein